MFLVDLLVVLAIALLLTTIFSVGLGNAGPWDSWLLFFVIVFLATWVGALWVRPVGPPLWGVYWLPALLVGLVFALVLAAAVPSRTPGMARRPEEREPVERQTALAVSVFLWLLLIGLLITVILGYMAI